MNYQETLSYIHQTPKFSRILGNTMLKKLLAHLGNPQDALDFIHVAGTNGKGSVSIMLAEILKNAGLRVGLFTSPYLERFNERIQINRTPIADEALAAIVTTIRACMESHNAPVSEFALDTAAAFCYFAQQKCDIVVLETGLGGRLDATNVISAKRAAVLTAIGMDHMQYLGDTIEKITLEKCGIIHPNTPVVSAPSQAESVRNTVLSYAKAHRAPVYFAEEPQLDGHGLQYRGQRFSLGRAEVEFYAPLGIYDDVNDLSLVTRITYGQTAFLFTGDAERPSENDMIDSDEALSATVLKVGHHGSNTSSSYLFLRQVMPSYAVISCGRDNAYGHPHQEVLARLRDIGAAVYRTDESGTIVCRSNGERVAFETEKGKKPTATPRKGQSVGYVGNIKSKKFHLSTCSSVQDIQQSNRITFATRAAAVKQGYSPCKACRP